MLASTTLLGTVALLSGSAHAEPPTVTFSGSLAYEAIFAGGDLAQAGTGTGITANDQMSELVWEARGTTESGLTYGAQAVWRYTTNTGVFDKTFVDLSGGWGQVILGSEDPVSDIVAGTSGHSFQEGAWGTDGNNALRNANYMTLSTLTHYFQSSAGMTGTTNKISYITPDFSGFQVGLSYTPQMGITGQQVQTNDAALNNVLDIAAGWTGEFSGVGLKIDGSYQFGDDDSGTNGATREDIRSFMLGGSIGLANFSLGLGYFNNGDSNTAKGAVNTDGGDGWNVGVAYNFGAGAISAMYQNATDDLDGNNLEDESTVWHIGTTYNIAEGLSAYGSYYNFELDDEGGVGAGNKNDAQVAIVGTRVTF